MNVPEPRDRRAPYAISIVCLGNICRSPIGEVVLRARLAMAGLDDRALVDSAGTGHWHIGESMDPRSVEALSRAGYDGSGHRARQFTEEWFADHDLILGMDEQNVATVRRMAPPESIEAGRIRLFGSYGRVGVITDPYAHGRRQFDKTVELAERAADDLVRELSTIA